MYDVTRTDKFAMGWICDCPDWTHRKVKCKHVWAVEFSIALRTSVKRNVVIEPLSPNVCLYCASTNIIHRGMRHNRYGDLQRFLCKSCGRRFTQNFGFEKMKASPEAITSAMQLYFSGESLRNTQKFLTLRGVQANHVTVYRWITKYVKLMQKYLEQMNPQLSDTWRADELFLKVKGEMKYLYAIMDNDTRFWLAQEVADTKGTADIRPLFKAAKITAGKKPHTLITDGAFNFESAFREEYKREREALAIQHIRHVRMSGDRNNNRMERFNGELRDREKVTRNIKKSDTPILAGMQIYHNYVRPHMGLKGKTPADLAGIEVKDKTNG